MKVLIIEDEPHAVEHLSKLISDVLPEASVAATFDSVKRSVEWLSRNTTPDLIFMDIQLADGLSFGIFEKVDIHAPVIFTTAYDAYALKAFKVNSIDYILKPIDREELSRAINKLGRLALKEPSVTMMENIGMAIEMLTRRYKNRFVIKVGEHLKTINVSGIRYFHSMDKATFCVTDENRSFVLDFTLEQLEEMLDPERFFRINRKYLVSAEAIHDIVTYTNSRLRLVLKGSSDNDIIVARERVQDFRAWLDR